MTSGITGERKDICGQLAERYMRGSGIETGAAPHGFPVPPRVHIRRIAGSALVKNEGGIGICDGPPANLDFCIAGHLPQDDGDPLVFLHRCLQVLRPGGMLFVLFPCRPAPSGRLRSLGGTLLSRIGGSPGFAPDAAVRRVLTEEKIGTLPVRVHWQGLSDIAGSCTFVCVLERFDYLVQIQELLQKKSAPFRNRPCTADIIIPVYNARDDLLRCLYSVIIHHENERIILIDDKSTDPATGSLISSLEPYRSSWFVLVRQEKNRGFAATVNRGMHHSRNDVILLNSDTIVTKGWVKKLQAAAGSLKNCGTLTPLSNNGTLCSVPVMMENNLLPPGVSIDSYADMVEQISFGQYPPIPAGTGFCLYITRACLDATGDFDEATYRAGYGEETDFCLRAAERGMTHYLCDTTFIYHRGMASFSAQAMTRLQKGIAALNARYPAYRNEVAEFIRHNPLSAIQENIACRTHTWDFSGCASRFLVIAGDESRNVCGQLAAASSDDVVCYHLGYNQSDLMVSEYFQRNRIDYLFRCGPPSPEAVPALLERILCSFRISGICVDHPDTRASEAAKKFHIPCRVFSFSSGPATRNGKETAPASFAGPGNPCNSGFPEILKTVKPLRERQEPDWSSGRRFTSAEIFHSIREFPEARFKGVIPFRPETSGSLPARFLRCLSENGVLYTLQRIRFFMINGKEENR